MQCGIYLHQTDTIFASIWIHQINYLYPPIVEQIGAKVAAKGNHIVICPNDMGLKHTLKKEHTML